MLKEAGRPGRRSGRSVATPSPAEMRLDNSGSSRTRAATPPRSPLIQRQVRRRLAPLRSMLVGVGRRGVGAAGRRKRPTLELCRMNACSPRNGSSPRVRGTPDDVACRRAPHPVHPRACGEHVASIVRPQPSAAVHPRACGEHLPTPATCRPIRFIPARAGNTAARQLREQPRHGSSPRVRGTRRSASFVPPASGSSPRVRGTRATSRVALGRQPVHPRACGEHHSKPSHCR